MLNKIDLPHVRSKQEELEAMIKAELDHTRFMSIRCDYFRYGAFLPSELFLACLKEEESLGLDALPLCLWGTAVGRAFSRGSGTGRGTGNAVYVVRFPTQCKAGALYSTRAKRFIFKDNFMIFLCNFFCML